MAYKTYSQFYIPRSKEELIKNILPMWNGTKTSLREMSVKRLRAIFLRLRQKKLMELMKK